MNVKERKSVCERAGERERERESERESETGTETEKRQADRVRQGQRKDRQTNRKNRIFHYFDNHFRWSSQFTILGNTGVVRSTKKAPLIRSLSRRLRRPTTRRTRASSDPCTRETSTKTIWRFKIGTTSRVRHLKR